MKCQAWAFVNLKNDFGRVLIRKETFADSVLELIHHTELKFPNDAGFNKNFYVVANDSEKAISAMTPDFRKMVVDNMDKNLTIEIINKTLVSQALKSIQYIEYQIFILYIICFFCKFFVFSYQKLAENA